MPGIRVSGQTGKGPPGTVWDPDLRAYVTPTQQVQGAQEREAALNTTGGHQFQMGAGGAVESVYRPPAPGGGAGTIPNPFTAAGTGYTPQYQSAGGQSGVHNSANDSNAALRALQSQIQASMASAGGQSAPQAPVTTNPYTGDGAGDRAQYTAAKERTGLALQSSLKGLRESLSSRGLSGSGIEGGAIGDAFSQGLGQLAATDRQMAEANSDRAFGVSQNNTDRTIQQNQYNTNLEAQSRLARSSESQRSLEMLLQIAGMYR